MLLFYQFLIYITLYVIMLVYNLVYCQNCWSIFFVVLIMVQLYEFFLQTVSEKLLCCEIHREKIFILPNTTHSHILRPLLNQRHIIDQLYRRNVFVYSLRYSTNCIVNVCIDFDNAIDNASSIIGGQIYYLWDKLHVILYEVGVRESLKKIDVLLKNSHIISIHMSNLKILLSIRSKNDSI